MRLADPFPFGYYLTARSRQFPTRAHVVEALGRGRVTPDGRLLVVMNKTPRLHELRLFPKNLIRVREGAQPRPLSLQPPSLHPDVPLPQYFFWVLPPTDPHARVSAKRATSSLSPDPARAAQGEQVGGIFRRQGVPMRATTRGDHAPSVPFSMGFRDISSWLL